MRRGGVIIHWSRACCGARNDVMKTASLQCSSPTTLHIFVTGYVLPKGSQSNFSTCSAVSHFWKCTSKI